MRIYYVNVNKKRLVGRCNQPNVLPLQLEYDIVENLSFQFIDDVNQIQDISDLRGLSLAIGKQPGKPSYDLLALSHDYTIEGNVLTFNVNTYTSNWLREIKKNNTEVYFEISQDFEGNKKVLVRDFCYAWPRVFVEGISPEIIEDDYYTKEETDAKIEEAISGLVPPSGDYATEEYVDNAVSGLASQEYVDTGLEGKQSLINADNKLAYDLLSGTPTIPTKTSDLNNDSDFQDAVQVQTAIDAAVSGKQDLITVDNKLDYGLISGAPETPTVEWGAISGTLSAQTDLQDALNAKANATDIPLSTSQLTNDSGFITNADLNGYATETYVDNAVSGLATEADLTTHTSDTDIHVTASEKEDWNGKLGPGDLPADIATETWVNEQLSAKQDAITNDNKLDYSLISGTPSIPLSTSELVNDSDFATSGYVNTQVTAATSGKLDKADYVAPYKLPYVGVEQGEDWWQEEGFENPWTDMDIIPNNKKIKVVPKGNDDILVFPTLYSDINENTVRTCEIWIKLAGNAATGAEAIEVPSSYFIVDEDNFPTSLKGEATANESYTYHVFVIRAVPRQGTGTSLCEICYSHFANSNISL